MHLLTISDIIRASGRYPQLDDEQLALLARRRETSAAGAFLVMLPFILLIVLIAYDMRTGVSDQGYARAGMAISMLAAVAMLCLSILRMAQTSLFRAEMGRRGLPLTSEPARQRAEGQ